MRLSEYLEPELVVIGLDTDGVEDTIAALVDRLARSGRMEETDAIRQAVVAREKSHTTSLGNGVALPHATVPGLPHPMILVGTAPDGIEFGPAADGQGVDRLFFLLLSPDNAAGTHIKILARIVRLVRSDDFVRSLLAADSGPALVAEIEREDALHV